MTTTNVLVAWRNFWPLMTLSGDQTPALGFGYTNTQNPIRSSLFRSTGTTSQYILGGMASGSLTCSCVGMFRHRCQGASARVRGFSNNDGTGTTLFDVPAGALYTPITTGYNHGYAENGFDPHDPLGGETPFFAYFTEVSGVKSVKWDLSNGSGMSAYSRAFFEIGKLFVGNYMSLLRSADFGLVYGLGDGTDSVRSRGGTLESSIGARWDTVDLSFNSLIETERVAWVDGMKLNQTGRDVMISIYPGAGGRIERDHTLNANLASLDGIGHEFHRFTKKLRVQGL